VTDKDQALQYLKEHDGVIRLADIRRLEIGSKTLQRLVHSGRLERVARGLYIDADQMEDSFLVAQYRCPRGVFCMDTALYLHRMTDRNPTRLVMTIPSGWNTPLLEQSNRYRFFYLKPELWRLGQTSLLTPSGHPVTAYDLERTICDCIRRIDELDRDEVLSAMKRYMKDPRARLKELLDYAEVFHLRDKMRQYMEVLR
jgi:predicted transcriptional regulator of viral defense system